MGKKLTRPSVILHTGIAKTGCTAIQHFCYYNRSQLKKLGLVYADTHYPECKNIDHMAHHILSHKWGGWLNVDKFPVTPDEAWDQFAATVLDTKENTIISSERFPDIFATPISRKALEFICNKLDFADVKVICYLRRQDDLAESHYKELVKGGFIGLTFEKYLENRIPKFFNYLTLLDNISSVIGRDNVIVRIYDRSQFESGNLILDFLKACNVNPPSNLNIPTSLHNTSLSNHSIALLSEPKLKFLRNVSEYRPLLRKLFDEKEAAGTTKTTIMSIETRKNIINKFADSNSAVISKYLSGGLTFKFDESSRENLKVFNDEEQMIEVRELKTLLAVFEKIVVNYTKDKLGI